MIPAKLYYEFTLLLAGVFASVFAVFPISVVRLWCCSDTVTFALRLWGYGLTPKAVCPAAVGAGSAGVCGAVADVFPWVVRVEPWW